MKVDSEISGQKGEAKGMRTLPPLGSVLSSVLLTGRDDIYNAAAIIHDGELARIYHKIYLPNYGVFDENRYFLISSG